MKLSNIELYYTPPENVNGSSLDIYGDDFLHIIKVMRHSINDEIYVTDGEGAIYTSVISSIGKDSLSAGIKSSVSFENKLKHITFCIPKIKSQDRLEFALEKCVELGITNFIIYESERSYKKGDKSERWNKIAVAAMKQSLHAWLPHIGITGSLQEIFEMKGEKILLEQDSDKSITNFVFNNGAAFRFIFGPEGGISPAEIKLFEKQNIYSLTSSRLRTETAVITCASIVSLNAAL